MTCDPNDNGLSEGTVVLKEERRCIDQGLRCELCYMFKYTDMKVGKFFPPVPLVINLKKKNEGKYSPF